MSPDEEWLLTSVEKVLDERLLQQWLPGYEPDLTKTAQANNQNRKPLSKQKLRQKALRQKQKPDKRR
jgi:hypothetical protein